MQQKKPVPGFLIVLMDVLLIGAALLLFAYFHHVRPQKAEGPKQNIVFGETPQVEATTAQPDTTPDAQIAQQEQPTPTPTATPEPEIGDFSAVFPTYDTGEGALYSYQTDNVRIAIRSDKYQDGVYFAADVWVRNIQQFRTAFAQGEFAKGSANYRMPLDIANDNNAMVAITGDYCGARSSGVLIRNGDLYRDSVSEDVCVLYADGVMETYYKNDFNLEDAVARGAYQSWSFGPKLLDNGQLPESYDGAEALLQPVLNNHAPRAGIGYFEPGHYCLVVVDGRQGDYSRGMTIPQFSELFLQLGCKDAYNLDGGQTSAMIYNGAVVNKPYKDGRVISDIIYFGG